MDMVPRSWYIQEETRRKIQDWQKVSSQFYATIKFMLEAPAHREILLRINDFIFHGQPKYTTQKVVCG
jgi:hypothetical protein